MTATRHPHWCDRVRCTATGRPPASRASTLREHLSARVPLHIRVAHGQVVADPSGGTVTAQLSQAVPPWRRETYLRISDTGGPAGHEVEMPLALAAALAGPLGSLLAAGTTNAAPGPAPLSLVPGPDPGPGGHGG